jgi:hypothetical protein
MRGTSGHALSFASDDEVGSSQRDPQRAERAIRHRIARCRAEHEESSVNDLGIAALPTR